MTTLHRWDNPETVRVRKYLSGSHLLLQALEVETAPTPADVAWREGSLRLLRYRPRTDRRHQVPVVLVYPPILRSYILDLVPGTSLAGYLVDEGFDVYLLDFGVLGDADRGVTLEDQVLGMLPAALAEVRGRSGASELTLVGHCMAGTMCAMYAAVDASDAAIRNLVLVAAPIDFAPSRPGVLGGWTMWTRQPVLDPEAIGRTAAALRGDALLRLLERVTTGRLWPWKLDAGRLPARPSFDAWLAMCQWVDDGIPFPGAALQQWYGDLFGHNALIRGEQRLAGQRIDLSKITSPVLAVAGRLDAVTPLALAAPWTRVLANAEVEFHTIDAGHVGMIVGPAGPGELWPRLVEWLTPRSHLGNADPTQHWSQQHPS